MWFAPDLGIDSLDQIPALLAKPFSDGERIQFFRSRRSRDGDGPPSQWAGNCNEIMNLEENRKYRHLADNEFGVRQYETLELYRINCYVWRALGRAQPATTGDVRDFMMTEDALNYLPSILRGDCRQLRALLRANREGMPWNQYSWAQHDRDPPPEKFITRGQNTFVRKTIIDGEVYFELIVKIVGRGDFDKDQKDDLLIFVLWANRPFSYRPEFRTLFGSLFLLNRHSAGDVLQGTESLAPWGNVLSRRSCWRRKSDFKI